MIPYSFTIQFWAEVMNQAEPIVYIIVITSARTKLSSMLPAYRPVFHNPSPERHQPSQECTELARTGTNAPEISENRPYESLFVGFTAN